MNNWNRNNQKSLHQLEVEKYVSMMKGYGITTIVAMNRYLSRNNMWEKFDSIKRMNTYASGKSSMGISIRAYKDIMSLCKTEDVITSRLITQSRV